MANSKKSAFTQQYQSVAEATGQKLGIAPSVLLAQWGLETGWGASVVPGTNNLGNIKDFSGSGAAAKDNMTGTVDNYRTYASPEEFAADYAALIERKYPKAVGTGDNIGAFASALKAGGYAEDPNYVQSLVNTHNSVTGGSDVAPAAVPDAAPVYRPRATAATEDATFNTRPAGVRPADSNSEKVTWSSYPDEVIPPNQTKPAAEFLSSMEQLAVVQEQAFAARAGYTPEQIVAVGAEATANRAQLATQLARSDSQRLDLDRTVDAGIQAARAKSDTNVAMRAAKSDVSFFDKVVASRTATSAILDWYERSNAAPDQKFNWIDNWQEKLSGYTADEQERLMKSQSSGPSSEAWDIVRNQINQQRLDDAKLQTGSTAGTVSAGLFAGITDIPSMVMFMGVGKVAQLGGVGARAYAAAGRPVAAVIASAGEAAAGGMLLDTTLAAAGEHYTVNDWAMNAGINLAMGAAFGLLHVKPAMRARDTAIVQDAQNALAANEAALWAQAQKNLPPHATEQQLKVEVDRIQLQESEDAMRFALAAVPDDRRLLPADVSKLPVRTADELAAAEIRHGVENIADDAERALALANYEGAERILANTTIDLSRVSQLTKAIGFESTGQTMLTSKNPLMQALGAVMVESSSGIAGRGRTAALSRHMNYKTFVGDFNTKYEQAYFGWRNENGGSFFEDATGGSKYRQFNRLVAEAIEDQAQGIGPLQALHPAVAAAVKLQRDGADLMRRAMQQVGTTGAARLGDNSVAYMTRTMSSEKVRAMTNNQKAAVVQILRDQFMELNGYDKAFATEHAKKYLDIANTRALGQVEMPLSIHDERAAGIVADSLKAMGLGEAQLQDILGRYSRGGANFTKGRANLSLNTTYEINGETFRLMDLVETDVPMLYRRYASRAAGEVALTQFGIQGRAGLESLRTALAHGSQKVTQKEIEAFDQIAAEFLGTPFGNRVRLVDNAAAATSILRLGGMGITQAAESLNGIGTVGLARTLASIGSIPRLVREAGMKIKGGAAKNPLLDSIEVVGGEIGLDHYRIATPFAQTDVIAKQAGMETYSTLDRIVKSGSNIQAKLSMHRAIMTAQTRGMSEQIVAKAARYMRDGIEDAALADMGFTADVMKALRKDINKIATWEGNKLVAFDITKATDPNAANAFVQGVHRGASQIIQGTYIGETGKWAHSSWLKMLTQFRTFSLISVEKQWNRQVGVHGAAKALGIMMGAASVAIPLQVARVHAASLGMSRSKAEEYRDRNLSPLALARSSMNYISILGLAPDFFDALAIPAGLEAEDVRGLGGGLGRIIPAVGAAEDVLKAGKTAAALSPLSKREVQDPGKTFQKITPFGRVPYLIPLINALGQD